MSGKAIILIGGTGAGKTTFLKERLKKVNPDNIYLFDINAEYLDLYKKPFVQFDKFTETANKITGGLIVFEEATIFLDNKGSDSTLREILVRKRHTKNTIYLVFHAFRFVPRYIYNLCNTIVVFRSNDDSALIESRFSNQALTDCFNRVSKAPKHYFEIFKIY